MKLDIAAPAPPWLHSQLRNDTHYIGALPLCAVLLMNNTACPWVILVPASGEWREVIELPPDLRRQFWAEVDLASQVLVKNFAPDKINIAALGNMVPQLHMHIVGRRADDPAWPRPVWGNLPPNPYADVAAGIDAWRRGFAAIGDF
jgi:diadenosine tetraphosphate (Ap4A) HIT family hydrolase